MGSEATSDSHVGHFFMKYMEQDPDDICQIDAATGQQELRRSVLSRSVRLAQSFRRYGLQPGDALVLAARNHLDAHIPLYAALMAGLPLAGVDPLFKYKEIKQLFKIVEPKIAFCQYEMCEDYRRAVEDLGLETKIVTFDFGDCTMAAFMEIYHNPEPESQFKVTSLDVSKIPCWLVSTSGSTGVPKVAALSHSFVLRNTPFFRHDVQDKSGERRCALVLSSTMWATACYSILAAPIAQVKLQTSAPATTDHIIDIINKYKPATMFCTPALLSLVLQHGAPCDLTCFDIIKMGGDQVNIRFLKALRAKVSKDTRIINSYGLTETGLALEPRAEGPLRGVGVPREGLEVKLICPNSGRTIVEPNVSGELLVKGSRMQCYYNNAKATSEAFTEDGFFKTGDLMYKDEDGYYFVVDRLKMLFKYQNHHIVPPEIEEVIISLRGVAAACVVGAPHPADGARAAAVVQRCAGAAVTAADIQRHVASQLSVYKQLHGGVIFVDEMPMTSNGKIDRNKAKAIVLQTERK